MSEYLDRKQVIELYEKYQPSLATHVYEFGEKLKALPIVKEETSRPHGEWIPCSKRLPKDCEIVLASFKTGVVQMCKYFDSVRDDSWWSYKDDCFAWDNTVVAWMPLPTPYMKER